ncbi:hypothetical protein [Haloarcula laminariae]|uniref:hypothetical protein n=1 Tax=Haloarcula laminariae TaxID=2961577 RepID=UPI0021C8FA15|nr:hypothetical protein [Halomicroarcula laminariae]
MSQSENTDDLTLIQEFLPDSVREEVSDLEKTIENSAFTQREYLAYVLKEFTEKTGSERADIMGISEGTYWGKTGRVKEQIGSAQATLELANLADEAKSEN